MLEDARSTAQHDIPHQGQPAGRGRARFHAAETQQAGPLTRGGTISAGAIQAVGSLQPARIVASPARELIRQQILAPTLTPGEACRGERSYAAP